VTSEPALAVDRREEGLRDWGWLTTTLRLYPRCGASRAAFLIVCLPITTTFPIEEDSLPLRRLAQHDHSQTCNPPHEAYLQQLSAMSCPTHPMHRRKRSGRRDALAACTPSGGCDDEHP
jgi:hypothetical protein